LLARCIKLAQGQDVTLYDHLGDAAWRLGDRAGARQAWNQALELARKARAAEEAAADTARIASLRSKLAALEKDEAPVVAPTAAEQK
jgi:predicted negative regulator of RcsB-dependent stress response